MITSTKKAPGKIFGRLLVGLSLVMMPLVVQAATNTFTFNNTTVGAGAGPVNPASGATSISGTNLTAGDVVVFDGIVVNVPGSTADAWGAINFNSGGFLGLVNAGLGVLVETGTASGNDCQLFLNGTGTSTHFGSAGLDAKTNRVHIELTCTQTGSTTNMNYLVQLDQGATGTFNASLTGASAVTFNGNTIALSFSANTQQHLFIQNQPLVAVAAPTPGTNTVVVGFAATFAASITRGYPLNTAQQWLSNGIPIAGATALTYTTPPTTAAYNGAQYSIIVTNLLVPGNVVTSAVAKLIVRSTPGIVTFNFPNTTVTAGGGTVTDPGISISGSQLLAGDTVVFDGIVTPNGTQASDAWTAINIQGGGYGGLFGATGLAVLTRMGGGANPSQLFINGSGVSNPTAGSAATNRVRIELYPSVNGSTTNMGWLVEIDQNLTGTFQPAVTGTNKTFVGNVLPLTFGSSGNSSFVTQNPQSPVSIFAGPAPLQVVAVGAPVSFGVTVKGWSPAFQWRRNGSAILNATNRNYTLPSVALGDNGAQFSVVVSNRLDSLNVVTSSVSTVSVLIPNNLSWYPLTDYTTWDIATANWTTNGGVTQTSFASGNNVTFDSLGYNIGGSTVSTTNTVSPNAVTVNVTSGEAYALAGTGSVSGQSLKVTGDGTGTLGLQSAASFNTVTIDPGSTLDVGYGGTDGSLGANFITNNGTIDFQNNAGVLSISGVITGTGSIIKDGSGTTVLSATNSAYAIQAVNAGVLSIASTPQPGAIVNNAEIQPASAASVLVIPNAISGGGYFNFIGFQTTILTGASTHTGLNTFFWSQVIVDNPQALGDAVSGSSEIFGADKFGGLYLSNNITWTQPLALDTRYTNGVSANAPHISNWSGTNVITSPLTFNTGAAAGLSGTEINVEAAAGLLTIDATSSLANNTTFAPVSLNLQGSARGVWNGILVDSGTPLNVLKRGTGTWTLGGANTYSGITTVASGTLEITNSSATASVAIQSGATLGGNGAIINGPVSVSGTLAPGLPNGNGTGVLTINSDLTFAAGSVARFRINQTTATNDVIAGVNNLTYGGTLVVSNLSGTLTTSDSFKLFSAAAYSGSFSSISPATPGTGLAWNSSTLATDGTLRITTGAATNPTNIVATVVGGNTLQLTWPLDHTGWTLQVQTNSLSVGLGTNWVRVPSSTATNQVSVPIVTANGSVFYRLVYP